MTAQQLKNSILQLAVQGKLVPQDPNDEPASVLLERIRAEKEALIKAKKIKREKNPSVLFRGADNTPYEKIGDKVEPLEVPFDIPDTWEWAKISDIFQIEMGQSPEGNSVSENSTGVEFHQGKVFFGKKYINVSHQTTSSPTKIAPPNSVLLCVRAPVGKVNITDRELCIGRGLCALSPLGGISTDFAYHLLETYEDAFIKQATGTTFVAITGEVVKNQIVPVPPLNEQQRILDCLYRLLPFIEEYGRVYEKSLSLDKAFPNDLKKSILQWAVQGKLVPQDPSDEPAEALLERIRGEKERLTREGKIKRDKTESVIFRRDNSHYEKLGEKVVCIDEEIPFEIPENWAWVRLGTISTYAHTKAKINAQNAPPNTWGLDLEDVEKGGRLLEMKTVAERKAVGDKTVFHKGDILYSKLRPYLLKILVAPADGICTPEIVPFSMFGNILSDYMVVYLSSPYVDNLINSITYGVKMPRVGTDTMVNLLVPLPPLEEQHRIVAIINEVLPYCKRI